LWNTGRILKQIKMGSRMGMLEGVLERQGVNALHGCRLITGPSPNCRRQTYEI
jgi:hypothetical protein